ncbi:transcriptional regulator family: Fungal Specific TF [Penicillium macrosclerotiorum]|uniref:transcriptional regulator family: Fungal Specific TF n=1 Tax=Penicillium macrosclerotiorum TaxID=303699 RepID=UPI0025475309|nr:transcriptional regulator family: Fungal Specific TF [Penicillium macrosclerotiorum]KAJ5675642.1 transcriptional regulator family: Fungal Specific TF [Penicillium macrosclerotiorum]
MRRVKKSRNGCSRCKSKRVKCGEEKPHCNRCTRLGVRCPGYIQSLKWVTKYEEPSPGASSDSSRVQGPATFTQPPNQSPHAIEDGHSLDTTSDGPSHGPDPPGFGLEEPHGLCDNLWDLPGSGSLPELTDLCPASPNTVSTSGFSQHPDLMYDFASTGDTTADLSRLLSLIGPPHGEEESVSSIYRDFSPSRIVRSYPPSSQTSRSTPRDFMSISRPLNNPSWTLIEYYFKEVAALFSSYDSQMNPFRTTVSRLWGSSLAMCRTMQSMAAATLVNDFPQFGPMGRKMRDEAVDIITREAVMDDKALLALLMLGQTASWHDPTDLGISFFNLLRKQLNSITASSNSPNLGFVKSIGNNYRFFEESLIYWEMLLSFVTDNDSMVFSDSPRSQSTGESLVLQRVPHPWTGIARDTQFTVHEVGRLVRRERKRIRARSFTSQDEIARAQKAIEKARELEERLLGLAHPSEAEIVSPGDDDTPVWHLLTMAEVYRCTGLLQLYRVFPDLLHNRLPDPGSAAPFPGPSGSQPRDPFFPIDLDSMAMPGSFEEPNARAAPAPVPVLYDTWLTEFALTTLSRLQTIPLESRTRCLQPFLLVASCSELRLPRPAAAATAADDDDEPGPDAPGISMGAIEVSRMRQFILGRLTSFLHVLPPKPINVCLQLVREVWRRMDAEEAETYWIDVMMEKGWETTMG